MTSDDVCLYRCWTEQVNGKPQKMQSCSCGIKSVITKKTMQDGIMEAIPPLGQSIEVFSHSDHKYHKMQAINCKWPECL